MRPRLLLLVFALLTTLASAVPLAQTSGAASPQEAVATLQKAIAAGNMLQALPVISPAGHKALANEAVTGLLMVMAFSDPDDAMPGGPKPSAAELGAKRKQYQQAKALAIQVMKPYGLDTLFGKPVLADDTQKPLNAALDQADNAALVTSIYASMEKIAPLLGMPKKPQPKPLIKTAAVTDYKIAGDTATARDGAEMLNFIRIGGRWYIGAASIGSSGGSSAEVTEPGQPAAPRATASGKEPEVVAGAIQIVKVTVADDGLGRPFQADNGTTLVLWVKLPAGQGLIELDEDASVLQHVGDDKGSNMGGRFGSFPKEFKDGRGGTIDITSSGFPASGATAILAEGTLSMRIASGTHKIRVAKVMLQNNAKLTLGKTPVVVAEVETQDDSQNFTLKLPRQVMTEIKQVVFLDAKGQPIEGSSTGNGYMNDAGEMRFTIKTAAKTLTLEFEMWHGLRTVKVPFSVKAGLGLD